MARPRQVSDEDILDAARACFVQEGPQVATSVIARVVGLSQAALFKRFGTKACLMLRALGLPDRPTWCTTADAGPTAAPMPEQLRDLGAEILTFFHDLVPRVWALKASGIQMDQVFGETEVPPPIAGQRALAGWFQRAIAAGQLREADANVLAIAFIGNFQARAFWQHVMGGALVSISDEVYVKQVTEVFWRGVAPDEVRP
jgi:AcrR family transcriptional regulator